MYFFEINYIINYNKISQKIKRNLGNNRVFFHCYMKYTVVGKKNNWISVQYNQNNLHNFLKFLQSNLEIYTLDNEVFYTLIR